MLNGEGAAVDGDYIVKIGPSTLPARLPPDTRGSGRRHPRTGVEWSFAKGNLEIQEFCSITGLRAHLNICEP